MKESQSQTGVSSLQNGAGITVATGLDGDAAGAIRHLWQACSEGLRRALHNDGAGTVATPEELLARVKSLAVQRRNNLVNILTLQRWVRRGMRVCWPSLPG